MQPNAYSEAINWLFQQFPSYQKMGAGAYKPGLENTRKLCAFFGNPQDELKFVHIAGTNGKGSTASFIAHALTHTKHKVGLFTSPHLEDFRERIRVNGEMIDHKSVVKFVDHIRQESDIPYSFFEISFVMALDYFRKQGCDICILETGMGGRLDSTNIVTPLISVITNIGLDHQQFLGDSLEQIAGEKAGIIKKNVPVVISEEQKETTKVFKRVAKEKNAPLLLAYELPLIKPPSHMPGEHQGKNYRAAIKTLQELEKVFPDVFYWFKEHSWDNFFENTGLRARLQKVKDVPEVYVDAAHNLDGISVLLKYFEEKIEKNSVRFIYGTSADKDLESIFKILPKNAHFHLTAFKSARSASTEKLDNEALKSGLRYSMHKDVKDAYNSALQELAPEETLVIFGSFFLIEDFFKISFE